MSLLGTHGLHGVYARIEWAYYPAATLTDYRVRRDETRWFLTASIVQADAFQLTRRPLVFVVPLRWQGQACEWRWPIRELEIRGGVVIASLDAPEEKNHGLLSRHTGTRPPNLG